MSRRARCRSTARLTTNEESYSARDWAVLQQILREDDDDDDVVEPPPPVQESPLQKHE